MKLKKIIDLFLKTNGYQNNRNIIGIILYGSATKEFNDDISDIDILVIKQNGYDYRGCNYIENIKVEYFEKSLTSLINEIECLDVILDRSLYSIFKTGDVILNKKGTIEYLNDLIENKDADSTKRRVRHKRLNMISHLLSIFNENKNDALKNYIYYNLIEEIRKYYHERNGFSKISSHKVKRLYLNEEEAERYCLFLPPTSFRKLYLKLLEGYDENIFGEYLETTMTNHLSEVSYDYICPCYDENYIKHEIIIIDNVLEKCMKLYETKDKTFLSTYYLVLERLRKLYINIHNLDNIPCDLNVLDSKFFEQMKMAIEGPSPRYLHILFLQVISDVKIDLKNYKIKC